MATKKIRIGSQMARAVDYVVANPGCCIRAVANRLHIAAECGTNNALGYDPVHRAIKAGLIVARSGRRSGTYALYAPEHDPNCENCARVS